MKLTLRMLENIKDIALNNRYMLHGEIDDIMRILNMESGLPKVQHFYSKEYTSFDTETGNILFNLDEMLKRSRVDICTEEDVKRVNLYILSTIFHEYFHYYQYICGKDELSFKEINELYSSLENDYNFLYRLLYKFVACHMYNERSANLFAYQNLLKITEDDYNEFCLAEYYYFLLDGYKKKSFGIVSPVNRTKSLIGRKKFDVSDTIPTDIKIFHGLPITKEEYDEYIKPIEQLGYKGIVGEQKILNLRW